ncbi:hypothetical protein PV08_11087 [Exophiala spinifera]|uniref:Uncharacterized protein n=1 Tax=Exophiala spinifera TaxID=91928 RepID=A0A0D1ZAT7_9EURO|nr:uncharacterized protein PV08_11087 [Exophiala spinifera]KIW10127.1 hypothetical protein PV08_11087 [Exophiala spinifera]
MANWSSTVPAGILGGLAGVMLLFIWWWFPRTWNKGVRQDNDRLDDVELQAQRAMVVQNARDIVDNYREVLKQRELTKNANIQQSTDTATEGRSIVTESTAREEETDHARFDTNPPRPDGRPGGPES